jgi:hypothetical protein
MEWLMGLAVSASTTAQIQGTARDFCRFVNCGSYDLVRTFGK